MSWRDLVWLAVVGRLILAPIEVEAQVGTDQPTAAAVPMAPGHSSSPVPPRPVAQSDRGRFAAVWVAPLSTHRFQGAGVEAGYRFGWLAALYRAGILQNGYAPPEQETPFLTLERKQRLLLELEVDGQLRFHDWVTLGIGGGAAFVVDRVDISSMNGFGWTTSTDERGRIRPLVSATLIGPLFQSGVTAYLGSQPEIRLSFGICWGRHARW